MSITNPNFYQKYGHLIPKRLENYQKVPAYLDQPDFVHFYKITYRLGNGEDHEEELAFLGKDPEESLKKARGSIYESYRLYLPEGLKLVNCQNLMAYLNTFGGNDYIDSEKVGYSLFYPGQIQPADKNKESNHVALNICTNIRNLPISFKDNPDEYRMELHYCDNFSQNRSDSFSLFGICSQMINNLSHWVKPASVSTQDVEPYHCPAYQSTIFYIDQSDVADDAEEKLCIYFRSKHTIHGYFLIPVGNPNGSSSYICIPNVDDYSYNEGEGVQHLLRHWITTTENFNPDTQYSGIGINDVLFLPVDAWSGCVYRDAKLFIKNKPKELLGKY